MNELEKDKLQPFLHDDLLVSIIKKFFNAETEKNTPQMNGLDNDVVLGQKYRAYIEAKHIIWKCFNELESYKVDKELKPDLNRAR